MKPKTTLSIDQLKDKERWLKKELENIKAALKKVQQEIKQHID